MFDIHAHVETTRSIDMKYTNMNRKNTSTSIVFTSSYVQSSYSETSL